METKKRNKISIPGNKSFNWSIGILTFLLATSLIFSIKDRVCHLIPWPPEYRNTIGMALQIVVTIISLIVSIIGIAISLQNEEIFGIKLTKLYALRVDKHYTILSIIMISITLCVLNLVCYMCDLQFAVLVISAVSISFLFQVIYTEVPIMAKQEKALLRILKTRLISCYLEGTETPKELKDSIKYLLYTETFKKIFQEFQDTSNEDYNKFIFRKLLEFQNDLASELRNNYTEYEQKIIGSSLLKNIPYIIFYQSDIWAKACNGLANNKYLLINPLFYIHKIASVKDNFSCTLSSLLQHLSLYPNDSEKNGLISDIIVDIVAATVSEGDFSVIKVIRQHLSMSPYSLSASSSALSVFGVLSMYLYYLCCSEPDVPNKLKAEIQTFISESGMIEERTEITSWKDLFSLETTTAFKGDYNQFISLAKRNEFDLTYHLFGIGLKPIILDTEYFSHWYLTNLFNLNYYQLNSFDFSTLLGKKDDYSSYIISFADKCLNELHRFVPTDEMNHIIDFYSDADEHFVFFKIDESKRHRFFYFINDLKYKKLKNEAAQITDVDNTAFAAKIKHGIETAIEAEWGFDHSLKIDNKERYFVMHLDNISDSASFDKLIVETYIEQILTELAKATLKTVIYKNDDFESNIQTTLSRNLKYVTLSAKDIVPLLYITDEGLKQKYTQICNNLTVFQSRILSDITLVSDNGFRFNCIVKKVEFRKLYDKELSDQVEQYQRADGQFVYQGTFLSREDIINIIQSKYRVMTIVIKYQIVSSKETVFELKPYCSHS